MLTQLRRYIKKLHKKKSKIREGIVSFHEKLFQETIHFDHLSKLTQALEIKIHSYDFIEFHN